MSWGVETRNPFLDYRIIEFGLGCRPEELLRGGLSKWVLREAMRDLLPRDVVERAQKQGFTTDEAHWMRGSLGVEMSEAFASDEMGRRPYFDRDALLRTLASHHAGDNRQIELWRAFMVERWLRLFVDAPRLTAPPSPSGLPAFTPRPLDRVISPNAAGAPTESAVAGAGRG